MSDGANGKPGPQVQFSAKQRELLEKRLLERAAAGARRVTISRRPDAEFSPVSFAQQRLWYLNILEPESSQYNIAQSLRLSGRLNYEAVRGALQTIVDRHEILRTTIHTAEGMPRQKTNSVASVECPVVDLSHLPEGERHDAMQAWRLELCSRIFNLANDVMLRAGLCKLAEDDHIFVFVMHHIASDGWSVDVFVREFAAAYTAILAGGVPKLDPLPIQYADFGVWQRDWFKGPVLQKQLEYWRTQLDGAPPTLELPADAPRHAVTGSKSASHRVLLPTVKLQRIEELSRAEGASLFMTLLAAFQLLMSRLTGRNDIVVGSPIAGRNRVEIENLIGFFVNTLVFRTQLDGNPTFRELIGRVRETTLGAYANQDLPFEKLVEEIHPERSMHRTPLFQVFFNMVNTASEKLSLPGVSSEVLPGAATDSKFELTLYSRLKPGGVEFNAVYNAGLFSNERIVELLDQYMQLLEQVTANPGLRIDDISLVTPRASKLLPDPTAPLSSECGPLLHERFSEQARQNPNSTVVADPSESWTYSELETRSNQLAQRLVKSGFKPGEVVGIYAHRCASLVWAMLATWKAGGAFVILDPSQPSGRLVDCLKIARPSAWLELEAAEPMSGMLSEHVMSSIDGSRQFRIPPRSKAGELFADETLSAPAVIVSPSSQAYIAFTSGSTGAPKGIAGSHGPLCHFVDWHVRTFGFTANDRFSMLSGLGHDPLLRDIFTPLAIGATIVIPDQDHIGSDRLGEWIAREKVSVAHLTPAMGQVLAGSRGDEGANSHPGRVTATSVRWLFFGGDRLTQFDVDRAATWAPAANCVNFYGATETPQAVAWHKVIRRDDGVGPPFESIPVGAGIDDVQLLVLNSAGRQCGIGEVGTIHVRTPFLALGYVGDDVMTSRRFVVNPYTQQPGDRMYATGDLGRYGLDGSVEFLGRNDDQVKIRGYRVELGEIESAIRDHEHVGNALITVANGTAGDPRIVAYVVPRNGEVPQSRDLRSFLKDRLPEYMVPAVYVPIERIPLTPNGKVNKAALPAPEHEKRDSDVGQDDGAPQTDSEKLIAGIWRELLHVDYVTVYDSFLDLGGHSLLGMEVIARVQKEGGVEIKPRELMFQTLGQIAAICDERKHEPAASQETQGGFAGRMFRSLKAAVGLPGDEK